MKVASVLFFAGVLATVQSADEEFCYGSVSEFCNKAQKKDNKLLGKDCTAEYGGINSVKQDLKNYAINHISRSNEYLMLATYFGQYEKSRPGFEKLYRDLSDDKWHHSIELIKYLSKRGVRVDFEHDDYVKPLEKTYEFDELESLAKVLDWEKGFATDAFDIHKRVQAHSSPNHDPEVSSYIEKEFVHDQANLIRKLSGYVAEANRFVRLESTVSLAINFLDEYLLKQ